jgi:hypothetical protein
MDKITHRPLGQTGSTTRWAVYLNKQRVGTIFANKGVYQYRPNNAISFGAGFPSFDACLNSLKSR